MDFSVTILGSSAALPTERRQCSAQLVQIHNHALLIDCGENTQVALRKQRLKLQKISHVFISHLHGDHILGLPGLLFTLHLLGRTEPMYVFSPKGLKEVIDQLLLVSNTTLNYDLHFIELAEDSNEIILDTEKFYVKKFPLLHKIETYGFLIQEKQDLLNIRKDVVKKYTLTIDEIKKIKQGEDYITPSGERISNKELILPPKELRSYAYCSDTAFFPDIIDTIKGTTVLYHETTFEANAEALAKEKFHTTSVQAAQMANLISAKQLIIGHISARYKDATPLLEEAKSVFQNTLLAEDGMRIEI
ncbi:ribonuclease Z [Bacteroidales bacterium OttesenSCG-928-C19]|nr:ribonuclease Z [Bacteroidales bacterium OttesenSCG-928-C19]